MEECWDTIRGVIHQPLLNRSYFITQFIWIAWLLTSILREMTYTIRYQLSTLSSIQFAFFIEEVIHIHALQLSDALFLRHSLI